MAGYKHGGADHLSRVACGASQSPQDGCPRHLGAWPGHLAEAEESCDHESGGCDQQLRADRLAVLAPISTSEQRMNAAARPVRMLLARCRRAGSTAMTRRCSDMATTTSPVRAAAPPPTVIKKSCHCAGWYGSITVEH